MLVLSAGKKEASLLLYAALKKHLLLQMRFQEPEVFVRLTRDLGEHIRSRLVSEVIRSIDFRPELVCGFRQALG